jgi:hypothetical protein
VSTDPTGSHTAPIAGGALSGDGAWVAFATDSHAVLAGNTHGAIQVYTRSFRRLSAPPT